MRFFDFNKPGAAKERRKKGGRKKEKKAPERGVGSSSAFMAVKTFYFSPQNPKFC